MLERAFVWLAAERSLRRLLITAGGIGLVFAFFVLGWEGIRGTSEYWRTTHNDTLQGIAALRYYLQESWSMPLLGVSSYGVPTGTNLIASDSIPLLAVPAKMIRWVLPAGFHYLGYWMALCFVLQPVAMVGLLASLRIRTYAAAIAGSVLALLQTALLARYLHVALMAQFTIIVALILGIQLVRGSNPVRRVWQLSVLLLALYFVHLYLFAMVLAITVAFVVQAALLRVIGWNVVARFVAGAVIGTALLIAGTGMGGAISHKAAGFGVHSMNLLALLGNFDATGGQYEGYAYLGPGAILLLVTVLVVGQDVYRPLLRRYWVPLVVSVAMAVFALSTSVWVGYAFQFDAPAVAPIEWLGFRFRSSGRFVWPLVYVLVAGGLVVAHRRFGARGAAALFVGVTIAQLVGMGPAALDLRRDLHTSEEQQLATEEWSTLVEQFDLVSLPPHGCVAKGSATVLASRELQRIAARVGVPITAAAVARRDTTCDDPVPEDLPEPGELRVVWDAVEGDYYLAGAECVHFDLGVACARPGPDAEALDLIAGS